MTKHIVAVVAALTLSTSALAVGGPGSGHHNSGSNANANSNSKSVGVGVGVASSKAAAMNLSSNRVTVIDQDSPYHAYEWQGRYEAKIRNTPSIDAVAPAPTISCYKTASISFGVPGVGGGLGGGSVDEKCEMRELIRLAQGSNDSGVQALASQLLSQELSKFVDEPEAPTASTGKPAADIAETDSQLARLQELGIL